MIRKSIIKPLRTVSISYQNWHSGFQTAKVYRTPESATRAWVDDRSIIWEAQGGNKRYNVTHKEAFREARRRRLYRRALPIFKKLFE